MSGVLQTIHSGALSAPLSPIIPRTPNLNLPPYQNGHFLSPSTPYTPYTPYTVSTDGYFGRHLHPPSSQNLNGRGSVDQHRQMALLETNTDDPLVHLFNNILRFIQRDSRDLVDLAERVNLARSYKRHKGRIANLSPGTREGLSEKMREEDDEEGFDIIGRVLWAEIGRAIMDELGSIIFAAGRPDDFQKVSLDPTLNRSTPSSFYSNDFYRWLQNYTTAHDFITALEHVAPSASAVVSMRSHRLYKSFERRWQLPVYFQLRWKDIIGTLEDSLSRAPSDASSDGELPSYTEYNHD